MLKKIRNFFLAAILSINFSSVYAKVLPEMNIDEKIGQMLCLDFRTWKNDFGQLQPVTQINDEIKDIIRKYHIGNVILFSENFQNKDQVKKLVFDLQSVAMESEGTPLFIYVDQEGGLIERFRFGRNRLENNIQIGGKGFDAEKYAYEKGSIIGQELSELGINCDLAPVVDINTNSLNPVINVRSFGNTPEVVSRCSVEFMKGLHNKNVLATAKHFPGHGDTSIDSHVGLPRVCKHIHQLEATELKPFRSMIESGVEFIMTAHIELPDIEKKTITSKKDGKEIFLPATLSKTVLTDILRGNMNFKGMIITDAMNMKAISEHVGESQAVLMALQAGVDIVCMPTTIRSVRDVRKLDAVYTLIKEHVSKDIGLILKINTSVKRILDAKQRLKPY